MNGWNVGRLGLLVVVAAVYAFRLGGAALWDIDEAIYADISRHMAESGDWVLPVFNGEPRFDKPPLVLWMQAAAMRLWGPGELAARLPSYLCGLAGIALTGAFAARLFSPRAGFWASLILATSLLWFIEARIGLLDTALSLFVALAVYFAHRVDQGHAPSHLGAWLALALGVLTKGPVAVVLAGGATLLGLGWRRWWRHLLSGWTVAGLALFAAVALPWHLAIYRRAGADWVSDYFGYHMVTRFTQPIEAHGYDWYFYLPVLAAGLLPWSGLGLAALGRAALRRLRGERAAGAVKPPRVAHGSIGGGARGIPGAGGVRGLPRGESSPTRLLGWWAGVVILFFSLSRTKLPGYILPAFPPLAMLLGAWLDERLQRTSASLPAVGIGGRRDRWVAGGLWSTVVVGLLAAAGLLMLKSQVPPEYLAAYRLLFTLPAGVALAGLLAALSRRLGSDGGTSVLVLGASTLALLLWTGGWLVPAVDQLRPVKPLALAARAYAPAGARLVSAMGDASTTFYSRSRVIYAMTPAAVAQLLTDPRTPTLALVPASFLPELEQSVPGLRILARASFGLLVTQGRPGEHSRQSPLHPGQAPQPLGRPPEHVGQRLQ